MLTRLKQSWFLLVLCASLAVGLAVGDRLMPYAQRVPKEAVIAVVMLAISLGTDFRKLLGGRGNWVAVALAVAINAAAAPPLGWLFAHALPDQLARGLILAMSVPCTVASAIVWTRRGGGNDVAAAVVTLVTNFGCFLTLPFWTAVLMGQSAAADPQSLTLKLLACVALPMLAGQLVRRLRAASDWADSVKVPLGLLSQWGVLSLALVGAISAGHAIRTQTDAPHASDWLGLLAVVFALHLTLLGVGLAFGRLAGLPRAERLTVLIAGSQKTMAVGLGVALDFGPLALFPLVAYHFTQLLVDTFLVDHWRKG